MQNSKQIAGLVGPTIVAMVVSECPLVQPHLYDTQIPPVIYLSGVIMFVGGLAIVRAHNLWERNWTLLLTVSGWSFLLLGLFRMVAAGSYQQGAASTAATTFMVLEGALLVVGLFLTYKGYRPDDR
jgi:FtsH-binding integral membrane protein